MREIPQRELRNEVSRVLAEVASGARFHVTVHGRPVAEIGPIRERNVWAPAGTAERIRRRGGLDEDFLADIAAAAGDTIESL